MFHFRCITCPSSTHILSERDRYTSNFGKKCNGKLKGNMRNTHRSMKLKKPPNILKNQVTGPEVFYYNIVNTVREQLSKMALSNFLPSLSLFSMKLFILSSYILPRIWNLSTTDLNLQLLCLGSSCWLPKSFSVQEVVQVKAVLHHHCFLCQFSRSHWSLLLVIICVLHSCSSTHT